MNTPAEASARIRSLLELRDRDPRTHKFVELAELYRARGDLEPARDVLEEGIRHHAHYVNARLLHARVLKDLGRRDEAIAAFEAALRIDAENSEAIDALAELREGIADTTRGNGGGGRGDGATAWLAGLDAEWRASGRRHDTEGAGSEEEAARVDEPVKDRGATGPGAYGGEGRDVGREDGPAELETATLAKLYVSQGLVEQAIGIYERLLARDPYNARLAAALEQARAHDRVGGPRRGSAVARVEDAPSRPPHPQLDGDRPAAGRPQQLAEPEPVVAETALSSMADDDAPATEAPDDASAVAEPSMGEFLESLLDGRAPPVESGSDAINWPEWLTDIGSGDGD